MRNITLISFICLLFSLSVHAQKGYEIGYIITNSNDTLVGLVKDKCKQGIPCITSEACIGIGEA